MTCQDCQDCVCQAPSEDWNLRVNQIACEVLGHAMQTFAMQTFENKRFREKHKWRACRRCGWASDLQAASLPSSAEYYVAGLHASLDSAVQQVSKKELRWNE